MTIITPINGKAFIPFPAPAVVQITAPITNAVSIVPPIAYTVEGSRTSVIPAGQTVILKLNQRNYLISTGNIPVTTINASQITGTKTNSFISDFSDAVRATVLQGLSLASATAITSSDSILSALGKLQAQITANVTDVLGTVLTGLDTSTAAIITASDTVLSGFGKLQAQVTDITTNFAATVRSTTLMGLSLATGTAITSADTVLSAFGKLQKQITDLAASAIAFTPYGSITATNVQTAIQQVEDFMNPSKVWYFYTDYEGTANSAATYSSDKMMVALTGGVIAPTASVAGHMGIAELSSSTSSTGSVLVGTAVNAVVLGAGVTVVEHLIRIPTLSTVAEAFTLRIGLVNGAANSGTDGVFFAVNDALNSGQWQIITRAASVETLVNTASAPVANTWYRMRIEINAAASSASFFINGAQVGTAIATNIPTAATGATVQIRKTNGTTARTLQLDYSMAYCKFTTPR